MSVRHLAKGSALPSVNHDLLRIYSMKFCPFAERTRLVLAHKNIPHEIVNINLMNKPEWLFERNPSGTVPVIEYQGRTLYESAICNEFLEDAFPGTESTALLSSDAFERAAAKLFMTLSDAKIKSVIGVLKAATPEKREEEHAVWTSGLQQLENHLTKTGETFFGGKRVGMADIHVWPFFERAPSVGALFGLDLLPAASFPRLTAWIAAMEDIEAVKKCRSSNDLHKRFFETFIPSGEPQYDLDLEPDSTKP